MRKIKKIVKYTAFVLLLSVGFISVAQPASALPVGASDFAVYQCGSSGTSGSSNYNAGDVVHTSINFGCYGDVCVNSNTNPYCTSPHNPIIDLSFAIIRLLSDGVGLVIIASIILAGIQYTFSRGEPQSVANATKRIQSSAIALLLFIFAYALLNFIIPNGVFGQ